jgi:hypothetical protein
MAQNGCKAMEKDGLILQINRYYCTRQRRVKQIFNISGNAQAGEKILSLRIGVRHCSFSISDRDGQQLYRLVWYSGAETDEHTLTDIYIKHAELRDVFHKVLVAFDHPPSIFVPENLYRQEDSRLLLETTYGRNGRDVIAAEEVKEWQIKNIYSVPYDVNHWVIQHFPKAIVLHSHTIAMKYFDPTEFEGGLMVDFRENDFSVIVSKANKLLMAQTFSYSSPSDVIYYLLKICKEFVFLQEQVRLTISGLIEKESALYRELYQYFLQLRFREPAWEIPVPEQESYPAHFFTSLNDLALCAS